MGQDALGSLLMCSALTTACILKMEAATLFYSEASTLGSWSQIRFGCEVEHKLAAIKYCFRLDFTNKKQKSPATQMTWKTAPVKEAPLTPFSNQRKKQPPVLQKAKLFLDQAVNFPSVVTLAD